MTERREIVPRWLCRDGYALTAAPNDRRQLFTGLDCYCRHYQSPASISSYRSRSRLADRRDTPDA
jgi:hypothetical protein